MQKLYYIEGNTDIPIGLVSSTARRGPKWDNQINVGDVVALTVTGTEEKLGEAVIVQKELATYCDVLDNADHNHVAHNQAKVDMLGGARRALQEELESAYGVNINPRENFTILWILPLNNTVPVQRPTTDTEKFADTVEVLRDAGVTAVEFAEYSHVGDSGVETEKFTRYEME